MKKGNCIVVMGALCLPRTEPSKIPRCARKSNSTVRRSCSWQQLQPAWEGVVILDSGTTTTAIARALRGFKNLTVITNAVNIAAELSATTLDVILFGLNRYAV